MKCPFCGTDKYLEVTEFTDKDYEPPKFKCWVDCLNCFAEGPVKGNKEAAIEAWNNNYRRMD